MYRFTVPESERRGLNPDEEAQRLDETDDLAFVDGNPKQHVIHLFEKTPNRRLQNRMNKIAVALDEWNDACHALENELGLPEADDLSSELYDPICELAERIEALKAHTIAGVHAKATVLRHW